MIERAISDMPMRLRAEHVTNALLGFSERLTSVERAGAAFDALANFAADAHMGALMLTIEPSGRPGRGQWSTLPDNRLGAFCASGIAALLEDLMPAGGRPTIFAWSTATRPGFHRVGDAAARACLFEGGMAGGITAAMTLPNGRNGRAYAIADDALIERIPVVARDLFLIASIHAFVAIDRCLGPMAPASLTRRELQMLELFAQGMRAREIAAAMNIAEATVKFHLLGVRRKLNAKTTREAAAILQQGTSTIMRSG